MTNVKFFSPNDFPQYILIYNLFAPVIWIFCALNNFWHLDVNILWTLYFNIDNLICKSPALYVVA